MMTPVNRKTSDAAHHKSSVQSKIGAFAVVMIMLTVVMVPFATYDGADSDGASTANISSIKIDLFDQESQDFTKLVYLSEKLPASLNAAEWKFDEDQRMWYNINSMSPYYGQILNYSMVPDITVDEIKSDISAFYAPFDFDFPIFQVSYTAFNKCNVDIEIKKTDMADSSKVRDIDMTAAGCVIKDRMQCATLYAIHAGGDLEPTDSRGIYSVTVKCNGDVLDSGDYSYYGSDYVLKGTVKDANGNTVAGADVRYNTGEGTSAKLIKTDKSGVYTIYAAKGAVINITSVSLAPLYSFDPEFNNLPYSYGTILKDVDVDEGPTFVANEHSVFVHVKDQKDKPVYGAQIKALWYVNKSGGIAEDNTNIQFTETTDIDGNAVVTFVKPVFSVYKMYVKAEAGDTPYTFAIDRITPGNNWETMPSVLAKGGNAYGDVETCADLSIKAEDSSLTATVTDNSGTHPLEGVVVTAEWYYQKGSGSIYDIKNSATSNPHNIEKKGTAGVVGRTGADGKVSVTYTLPRLGDSGALAFLVVRAYAPGTEEGSPASMYTFNIPSAIASGTESVETIIADKEGSDTCQSTAMADFNLKSREVAYKVTGTITGDVPDEMTVSYQIGNSRNSMILHPEGGSIQFSYVVMKGQSSVIRFSPVINTVFTPDAVKGYAVATASKDIACEFSAMTTINPCDRDAPIQLDSYSVEGMTPGDLATFVYQVNDVNCNMIIEADPAGNAKLFISGWPGNRISGMNVSCGDEYYIGETVGHTTKVSKLVMKSFVTYYAEMDIPTMGNIVGNQVISIFCDGELYKNVNTNTDGIVHVTVPAIADVSYKFRDYTIVPTHQTQDAFDGFEAFNLKGYIQEQVVKTSTITVKYVSSMTDSEGNPRTDEIIAEPFNRNLEVGEVEKFVAPKMDGFVFSGWFINGVLVSNNNNIYITDLTVTEAMDGSELLAVYSKEIFEEPAVKIDNSVLIVGLLGIMIAVLALVYVILQIRRY